MSRLRFSLSSDQLELLLAFEESRGLSDLAEKMAKDTSVVSRNLQKIAEDFPVIEKVKGRWELTPLGEETNQLTKGYLKTHHELLFDKLKKSDSANYSFAEKTVALIIINAQNGLIDQTQSGKNNTEAEKNIQKILVHWRKEKRPVFYAKHVSENPESMYYRESHKCEILNSLTPLENEIVIEKTQSSAFAASNLQEALNKLECTEVVLVGFTAHECIDATARESAALGFTTYVVGNATATFDMRDPLGKLIKAEKVHKLTMTNINAFYAKVIETAEVCL